jgi:uncharacterized protein involved in type VI secretion and phage assembly
MSLENIVANLVQKVERRFYGKYRGFVVDNADPEHLGRLKVKVPSVLGNDVVTGWAAPCAPYGGSPGQGFLFIPEIDAGVWIEFEEGDLEFPIWVGTFWSKPGGESELPKPNDAQGQEQGNAQTPPTRKIIKTQKGHTIQLEDAGNEEMITIIEAKNKHVITMNKDGITVKEGINAHEMTMSKEGVKVTDGANKHEVSLAKDGIIISDGKNTGNKITMEQSGLKIEDKNGNQVLMGASGIQVGSSSASEFFVLGTQFAAKVAAFITSLGTHTHVGNMGAPTSPPMAPITLEVPISTKHKVE